MPFEETARADIHIPKGAYYKLEFWIELDDVVFLTAGSTVRIQIRASKSQKSKVLAEFGNITIDGSIAEYPEADNNVISGDLLEAVTLAIDETEGWYDVLVIDSDGKGSYPLEGRVHFHGTVTEIP